MVVLYNSKYKQSTYELGGNKLAEFLEYAFITESEDTQKLIEETKAFKNGEIWVEDKFDNLGELVESQKKKKEKRRRKIVSGPRGTED